MIDDRDSTKAILINEFKKLDRLKNLEWIIPVINMIKIIALIKLRGPEPKRFTLYNNIHNTKR